MSEDVVAEQECRPLTARELYAKFGAALVPVITSDEDGNEHIGSAFHVGDGVFVTAKHVVENQVSCAVEIDSYRISQLARSLTDLWARDDAELIPVEAVLHPEPDKDVAAFVCPTLSALPAIPLGDHLDDWIADHQFILNEVLILGFPPIPLARKNVLVAFRGQINAVVDLINVSHVHFIVSATARGGLSGGVVLSEWGFALGVITSSLLKNGAPEELGYLTVLTVEPILECLGMHRMLPRQVAAQWDGLFTAEHLHFGAVDQGWAHSWIGSNRDGWSARVSYNTPRDEVRAHMDSVMTQAGFSEEKPVGKERRWIYSGDYNVSAGTVELTVLALTKILENEGYQRVERPSIIHQTIDMDEALRHFPKKLLPD